VAREIVHDDDIALPQRWRELGLHIGLKDRAVHGRIDDPRRNEAIAFEARHKCRVPRCPKGALLFGRSPLTERPRRRTILVLVLVSSTKTNRALMLTHDGLAAIAPFGPGRGQFRPVLFAGPKGFF
jgi:hypothetical protein